MKRKHYISFLILSAITVNIVEADTHSELSNIFTLDTREALPEQVQSIRH